MLISLSRYASVFVLVAALFAPVSSLHAQQTPDTQGIYERAEVVRVHSQTRDTSSTTSEQVDAYQIKFSTGPLQGQERTVLSDVGNNPSQIHPSAGDSIVTFLQRGDTPDSWDIYIEGFDRQGAIIWLVLLFVATMILLAGWQGVKVALSIGISIGMIGYVLIPLFLAGWNPVPVAIVLSGFFTVLSCGLSTGWDKKAMITALGTIGGALVAYLLSVIFVNWTHLAGLSSEEDRLFFQKNPGLNPRGLLFAGIIIASAGVLEDVAVSIVSGISEVHRVNPRAGFRDLFISGMAVGRDHMAALANTLIYAYVGGSLSSLLLYKQYGQSWLKFMNFDSVVDEVIRSLCGTIGLVFTIPISAFLAAFVMSRSSWKDTSEPTHTHHGHTHSPHPHV